MDVSDNAEIVGSMTGGASSRSTRARSRKIVNLLNNPGLLFSSPLIFLMVIGFFGPLVLVIVFAFMPPKTFSLLNKPTLINFIQIFEGSYYISFMNSLFLAICTAAICFLVCYPLAVSMVRVFGKYGSALVLLITAPLFVADNLRLMGWVLFLVKGGVVSGGLQSFLGIELESMIYTTGATLFGLVYIYLPFMLFPVVMGVSLVPDEVRQAAFDLGASRFQVMHEIDIRMAMPGIMIGSLMTFILAAGSLTEARILGGSAVVMIAMDIQKEFTFAQNWPRGSALSVLMILLAGTLSFVALKRIDLDAVFGRK